MVWKAILIAAVLALSCSVPIALTAQDGWKSGQDSPVHDSDRAYPPASERIVLENRGLRVAFDKGTGALVELEERETGWGIQARPDAAESFRMFVPLPGRDYNPVLGARNKLSSWQLSPDRQSLTLTWSSLQSEYGGPLDITLRGEVRLSQLAISFTATITNHSPYTVDTVSWPILGGLTPPHGENGLKREDIRWATLIQAPILPGMANEFGYWGTNWPTSMVNSRFVLVSGSRQGFYFGNHDTSQQEVVAYMFQLEPGYAESFASLGPSENRISGHRVRTSLEAVHYSYAGSGQSSQLSQIVISPYQGDWHAGVDIYKRWKDTWFHRPPAPLWIQDINSWQTLQINSSEDDLRTLYRELPDRVAQAARFGISAIQLIGWNDGGQDRGNPSHDTDARLGTQQELKNAIAESQKMGVRIILFNKYTWADITSDRYRKELHQYMAADPYGNPYYFAGDRYQTPMQLEGINVRNFAVACLNEPHWQAIVKAEFQKSLDLGADGILYDEAEHHGGADLCFSSQHGHKVPSTLWSGDSALGEVLRQMIRNSAGEDNFLLAAEYPYDLEYKYYSLSEFRIRPGHVPADRYADPWEPMMISITGFDDRVMINRALMNRYILMYEPFNFKGNLDDFPLTMNYGQQVDALRKKYRAYLWDSEFRDTLEARVIANGKPYWIYSVFRQSGSGKHAVVVANDDPSSELRAQVFIEHARPNGVTWVSAEHPAPHPYTGSISIPARSVVVLLEP